MLRLTLRTLLSYLDDTLEPSEATALGAKLAESEQAQEIVERMRNVIRRRRLTVPLAASRMDPNTIAEYLDNEISPEQAEELERVCLASDVHLAEVAACHQTLSLILGDPPEVPADAIRRMIDLARGTPTVPRKSRPAAAPASTNHAKPHAPHPAHAAALGDEALPSLAGKSWLGRVAVGLGAAAACVLLGVAIHQLISPPVTPGPKPQQQAKAALPKFNSAKEEILYVPPIPFDPKLVDVKPPEAKIVDTKPEVVKPAEAKAPDAKAPEAKPEPTPIAKVEPKPAPITDADLPAPTFSTTPEPKTTAKMADVPMGPPSATVAALGMMVEPAKDAPAVVLQRLDTPTAWNRLTPQPGKTTEIYSTRPLVALPASRGVLDLGKVRLTLWGHVPESASSLAIVESLVELHSPDKGVDLDLTLRRGRIVIASISDRSLFARIRFENTGDPAGAEASWLVSLPSKGTTVLLDRWAQVRRDDPFVRDPAAASRKGPQSFVSCIALEGMPMLKTATEVVSMSPPPGSALAIWDSRTNKLVTAGLKELPPWFDPRTKPTADIVKVRKALDAGFTGKAPDLALTELLKSTDPLTRRTAVRCLGAFDDLSGLLEVLNQDKADLRHTAIETLYCWIGASRNNDYKLYEKFKERLSETDSTIAMSLLHGVTEQAAAVPDTYQLLIANLIHPQMTIRELSRWNLYALVPAGANIVYDAADPVVREAAHKRWQQLIPPGKMPPTKKS
jgi:hypothetical protein